jgi:hypothetical protein
MKITPVKVRNTDAIAVKHNWAPGILCREIDGHIWLTEWPESLGLPPTEEEILQWEIEYEAPPWPPTLEERAESLEARLAALEAVVHGRPA